MATIISVAIISLLMISTSLKAQLSHGRSGDTLVTEPPGEKEILAYNGIREADVFWQKRIWRVIDTREKINLPFRYEGIDWLELKPLITILRNAVLAGTVTAYNEDNLKSVMTAEDVMKIGSSIDTIPVYNLDGEWMGDTVIQNEFNPATVVKFRIKEDWFFDEETSTMQCRIMSLAPIYTDEDFGIDIAMFWLYYPELRPVLMKEEVFNWKNDAVRQTWDDLFESRMFSSYIFKESNVFDRRIQDYLTGADALFESDRIKQQIFEFEHDLWSF